MTSTPHTAVAIERTKRIERAFFHGAALTLNNAAYFHALRTLTELLLADDQNPRDLTVAALEIEPVASSAFIVARESGVAAGLTELSWFLRSVGIEPVLEKRDGDILKSGDILLRAEGPRNKLLSCERVGLNLLQRMSGIATVTNRLRSLVNSVSASVQIVATRKTPWGALDKRAVHLGGGGTHRLGLGDAILIKNNHLALIARDEVTAAPIAIERAWRFRRESAFIEVEVRTQEAAVAAARTFRRLRRDTSPDYPCLLMLDNMAPGEIAFVIEALRSEDLWDDVLIEASGSISESNVTAYAASGVDVISVGSLTHSVRALDLSQRIS